MCQIKQFKVRICLERLLCCCFLTLFTLHFLDEDGCLCVWWSVCSARSLTFLNRLYHLKRCDWLVWIKIIALSKKIDQNKSRCLGTRNIQNETTCGSCNLFHYYWPMRTRGNCKPFYWCVVFLLLCMCADSRRCPSQTPIVRVSHTHSQTHINKIVNLMPHFSHLRIIFLDWYGLDAIVVIVNSQFRVC